MNEQCTKNRYTVLTERDIKLLYDFFDVDSSGAVTFSNFQAVVCEKDYYE
jgi:hypothetical protein